jgi:RNA polymerase sigma-70 factor (ECF subfamily)
MSRNHSPSQPGSSKAREASASAPPSFETEILVLLPKLRRYARSITRSDGESEDLLQDCVEKALINRRQMRGSSIKSWLYRIMINLHLNALRSVASRRSVPMEEAADLAADQDTDDVLERDCLVTALNTLPAEARAVLMLVVVEGYTYQEVAGVMDIPIGTVMSRLSRARGALRDRMLEKNVVPLRRPR